MLFFFSEGFLYLIRMSSWRRQSPRLGGAEGLPRKRARVSEPELPETVQVLYSQNTGTVVQNTGTVVQNTGTVVQNTKVTNFFSSFCTKM